MRKKAYTIRGVDAFYRNSPIPIQNLMFSGYGVLKALNYYSPIFRKRLAYLEKTQWMRPDEIQRIQLENLRKVTKHAYENVPYYHSLFRVLDLKPGDIKGFGDLQKIPPLTKRIVMEHRKDLMATNASSFRPRQFNTGGTTGNPLQFYMDREMFLLRDAEKYRHWRAHGYRFRDKMVTLRGRALITEKGGSSVPWRHDHVQNFLFLSSYHLNGEHMDRYHELLLKWKPKYLQAYPSAAYILASHFLKKETHIRLKCVFTSSEMVLPKYRSTIEEAFGCDVVDHYGHGEPGTWISGQCLEHNHHLSAELSYMEFLRDGEVVPHGEKGEILDTSLTNYSMPFIRFRIGDIGRLSLDECPCGRGLPIIAEIEGRSDDFIVTAEGESIPPPALTLTYEFILNIRQCQFIQESQNEVTVRIVREPGYNDSDTEEFMKKLKATIGTQTDIHFDFVDRIPLTRGGKFRFIIRNDKRET
jgi:phenylacetate-CoA ligase